jgi:hypothetical protein
MRILNHGGNQKATVYADVDGDWSEYNSQIKFMFY